MIFDTHCHLGYHWEDGADDDAQAAYERSVEAGVCEILNVGINLETSRRARQWARKLDGVLYSAGLHPNDAGEFDSEWDAIAAIAGEEDCSAVGETGLDFYRDWTTPQQQILSFEKHLELSLELDRPVIVHCRDAFDQVFEVIAKHPGTRGVIHCFSGNLEDARAALELGFHVSFAGPLTYKKSEALREAAAFVPADRILIETDAPFLPPHPWRGQRNEPAYIRATLETLAQVRDTNLDEMARITRENARMLFNA